MANKELKDNKRFTPTAISNKEIMEQKNTEENQKLIDEALEKEGGKDKEKLIAVTTMLPQATYDALQRVVAYYRSPSMSHAMRLMIDDVAKGLEQDEVSSRFKLKGD